MSTGLPGKKFVGKIVKGTDPEQRGRYLVHIPEDLQHQAESEGRWCTNSIQPTHLTSSDKGRYGTYMPLHPGTLVQVECDIDDFRSARITRIVSDQKEKSDLDAGYVAGVIPTGKGDEDGERKEYKPEEMPKKKLEERDEQYIVVLTPNRTTIYINEATEEDSEAIFISYKGKETVFRINGDGVHISTDGNNRERISVNNEVVIDGSSSIQVKGGNYDIFVDGDVNFKASGNINIEAEGDINLKAGGNINEDGSEIYLNSGMAESAEPVQTEVCKI